MHFGQRLKRIMELKKIKQKDFAKMLNTTPQNLSKIFTKENLNTEILNNVSDVLGISMAELFSENISEMSGNKPLKSKPKVEFELNEKDILLIDLDNKRLQILK